MKSVTKNELLQLTICKQLYLNKQLSSPELSEKIGKSLPSTIKLLGELIAAEKVQEMGFGHSTGGRKPMLYALVPDGSLILSVAMNHLITRIALVNLRNELVLPVEKISLPLYQNNCSLQQLSDSLDRYLQREPALRSRIIGIGIGMPGFVDVKKGINYSFLPSKAGSVNNYLEKRLGVPVYIDNDSSLIALAELRFGTAKASKNAMVINISWGIGLGMIINGELFRGHNGFAGEFSHLPLFSSDKMCGCGKTGCLETEASLTVIAEQVRAGLQEGKVSAVRLLSADNDADICEKVFDAALNGDRFCINILSEVGYKIGKGLAILIHLMNPDMIVLSGRGAIAAKILMAPIQQAINEHCIPRLALNSTIKLSVMDEDAEIIGAATLVMESLAKNLLPTRKDEFTNNSLY